MSLASRNSSLFTRAQALKEVRAFFEQRAVLEVDTPLLSTYAPIDLHIDPFEVEGGYLHSSPEYAMKKLLAAGSGDIYQLGHVFRKGEMGALHSPEFTMIEWYRLDTTEEAFIKENLELISLFLKDLSPKQLSYHEAFERAVGLPLHAPPHLLMTQAASRGLYLHDEQDIINLLWGSLVEPTFQDLTIIREFPHDQAALAQIRSGVAERFEIYYKGIELGNGYHELRDPIEQKKRLEQTNQARVALGKPPLICDPELLASLEKGLPDCYGIALGFDRLLMLREGRRTIHPHLF